MPVRAQSCSHHEGPDLERFPEAAQLPTALEATEIGTESFAGGILIKQIAFQSRVTIRLLDAECPPMLSRELKRPEHPYAVDFGLCILFEFFTVFTYSFFVSVRILSESWIC